MPEASPDMTMALAGFGLDDDPSHGPNETNNLVGFQAGIRSWSPIPHASAH
jgi:hypothetical protein